MDRRTLGPIGTWLRRYRTEKGRKLEKGRYTQARARNSLVCPAGEESSGERWRPAGRGVIQVDGRSMPWRDSRGESGLNKERSGNNG